MKTESEIRDYISSSGNWYHIINLPFGIQTPGNSLISHQWEMMRRARSHIDYHGKLVLDLASWDGLWAFEAESQGARQVVATDCFYSLALQHFLFCRDAMDSKAIPYYNVSPYNLKDRLDVCLHEFGPFEIVQHLGLLYHLRDPLRSISQCRAIMKPGGILWLETAFWKPCADSLMLFNGDTSRFYKDLTTWWIPTEPCIDQMFIMSGFKKIETVREVIDQNENMGRISLAYMALPPEDISHELLLELRRIYRNPECSI